MSLPLRAAAANSAMNRDCGTVSSQLYGPGMGERSLVDHQTPWYDPKPTAGPCLSGHRQSRSLREEGVADSPARTAKAAAPPREHSQTPFQKCEFPACFHVLFLLASPQFQNCHAHSLFSLHCLLLWLLSALQSSISQNLAAIHFITHQFQLNRSHNLPNALPCGLGTPSSQGKAMSSNSFLTDTLFLKCWSLPDYNHTSDHDQEDTVLPACGSINQGQEV